MHSRERPPFSVVSCPWASRNCPKSSQTQGLFWPGGQAISSAPRRQRRCLVQLQGVGVGDQCLRLWSSGSKTHKHVCKHIQHSSWHLLRVSGHRELLGGLAGLLRGGVLRLRGVASPSPSDPPPPPPNFPHIPARASRVTPRSGPQKGPGPVGKGRSVSDWQARRMSCTQPRQKPQPPGAARGHGHLPSPGQQEAEKNAAAEPRQASPFFTLRASWRFIHASVSEHTCFHVHTSNRRFHSSEMSGTARAHAAVARHEAACRRQDGRMKTRRHRRHK